MRLRLLAAGLTTALTLTGLAATALPAGAAAPSLLRGSTAAAPAAGTASAAAPGAAAGTASSAPVPGADDPAVLTEEEGPAAPGGPLASAAVDPGAAARALVSGAAASPLAPALGYPVPKSPVRLPAALDVQPSYVPQKSCSGYAKPGAIRLRDTLLATYPGTASFGIAASCTARSAVSEHLDGRAFDWKVSASVLRQRKQAEAFLNWLIAGNGVNARRMGVMYVIWNGRIWGAYSPQLGWRVQSCSGVTGCHRDHVHISMTWDGAYARTSFWTGRALTVQDYGSCLANGSYFAGNHSWRAPRATPCPTWKPLAATDPVLTTIRANAGRTMSVREVGAGMVAVMRVLGGEPATGRVTVLTGQELAAFQYRRGLSRTGTITPQTWRSLASYASDGAVRIR